MGTQQYTVNIVTTKDGWKNEVKTFDSMEAAKHWLNSQQASHIMIYPADKVPRAARYLEETAKTGSWAAAKAAVLGTPTPAAAVTDAPSPKEEARVEETEDGESK